MERERGENVRMVGQRAAMRKRRTKTRMWTQTVILLLQGEIKAPYPGTGKPFPNPLLKALRTAQIPIYTSSGQADPKGICRGLLRRVVVMVCIPSYTFHFVIPVQYRPHLL